MTNHILASLSAHYAWQLSLLAGLGIVALTFLLNWVLSLNPTFRAAQQANKAAFAAKMAKPHYAANQKWNRKWSLSYLVAIFGLILPFCLTLEAKPWWQMLLDIAMILMVYDFFYYLVHRFVFHGTLTWVHAVHHRQHNPCRWDSSYIHPIEVAVGLGLYVATIFVLSRLMGNFHVATIVITFIAFTEINLHNHDLWKEKRFPFGYLNTMSVMHHHHHATYSGGNFATISLLYDWMFGTLDKGGGLRAKGTV
jgi:sterol desaturase/sphingolipid hydroxylase (fatty acid hydroxylase superfamily)